MTVRLLLARHAMTADTRAARFSATSGARSVEGCQPLDAAGRAQACALRDHLSAVDGVWTSLAVRTRQTADHAGLDEAVGLPALAELDFGAWAGRDPHDVALAEADALKAWYADADASPPPAGERFGALLARVRVVLSPAAACEGTTIAVTHGGVVKAALAEVLGLAPDVLWRLDLAPASVTELHHSHGAWRVACVNWTPSCGGRS